MIKFLNGAKLTVALIDIDIRTFSRGGRPGEVIPHGSGKIKFMEE